MDEKEQLVKSAIIGDRVALQKLLKEEKESLFKMAFLYMKNEHDALEVFQQTVLEVMESIHQLRSPAYFSTWVTRICINVSLTMLKKNKKVIPMETLPLSAVADGSGSSAEERLDLKHALFDLEEKYRTVLVLRFYKDYTVPQIASLLHCPEGTVKTNLHRGISLLKDKMKGVYTDERRNESN